jgi:transcriptional regulator with XRE-family HTH domain
MRYGERLRLARTTAKGEKISQAKLAELARVEQSLISQLENSQTAEGSQYTNRLAKALGISPDWLADEEGEMIPVRTAQQYLDPRIEHVCQVMQSLPPYAVDAGVREIDSLAELIKQIPPPDTATRPARQPLATPTPQQGGGLPFSYKPGDTGRAKAIPADKKKHGSEQ